MVSSSPRPKIESYKCTMRKRAALRKDILNQRVEEAQNVAMQAAEWIKQTYGVKHVWLFGSLIQSQWFTMTSDIDLAIEELSPGDCLTAVAKLQDISQNFKIDLVQLERIPLGFKSVVLAEGRLL